MFIWYLPTKILHLVHIILFGYHYFRLWSFSMQANSPITLVNSINKRAKRLESIERVKFNSWHYLLNRILFTDSNGVFATLYLVLTKKDVNIVVIILLNDWHNDTILKRKISEIIFYVKKSDVDSDFRL